MQYYTLYLIQLLAFIGLSINLHFIYRHHFKKDKKSKHIKLCAGNKCDLLIESKYANLFFTPNYILSAFYYATILIFSFTPYFLGNVRYLISAVMWFVAMLSTVLIFILVFKLKAKCIVCLTSMTVNLLIAIIYTL